MGYNLFQRRGPADADSNHSSESNDFAATVASLPPGFEPLPAPADLNSAQDSQPAGPDSGTQDSLPAATDTRVEQSPTLSHIGRYALKGPLGQGGLGQVHEAWDPLLSRTVAIKTLQFDIGQNERVSLDGLFLNEARAAAGLSHPHIVTIHDAGLSPQGVYIAMERLHGRDLRQALAAGWQPPPEQAALLVRRVAEALAYAHARGVVHCDIKPANIFLCRRDKPKVLDFGIARVAHSSALALLDGLVAGSPHYLAPEQLEGGMVDARTDIHALGVVFYELLAMRKAYSGDSVEQIGNAVLNNHPAPAHEVRPGVSRTLSAIASKAMERDPTQRFASAMAMAMELRRWADRHAAPEQAAFADTPALEAPPPERRRTRDLRQRSGLKVALWSGTALAGVALAGTLLRTPGAELAPDSTAAAAVAAPALPAAAVLAAAPLTQPAPMAPIESEAAATPPAATPEGAAVAAPADVAPSRPVNAAAAKPSAAVRSKAAPAAATARPARPASPAAPVANGTVQLAISPWGQVEVDGSPAGTAPPLTQLSLSEGSHTITVRNEDFPPFTATVQVQADKPVALRHRFAP